MKIAVIKQNTWKERKEMHTSQCAWMDHTTVTMTNTGCMRFQINTFYTSNMTPERQRYTDVTFIDDSKMYHSTTFSHS